MSEAAHWEHEAAAHGRAGEAAAAVECAAEAESAYLRAGAAHRVPDLWGSADLRYVPKLTPVVAPGSGTAPALLLESIDARRTGDLVAARDLAQRAWQVAWEAGALDQALEAAEALGHSGDADAARATLHEGWRAAREAGRPLTAARALAGLSRLAWALGDPMAADAANRAALVEARRVADASLWRHLEVGYAAQLAWRGELDDGERLARQMVRDGPELLAAFAECPLAFVELDRGPDAKTARRIHRLADAVRDFDVAFLSCPVLLIKARLRLAAGDGRGALADLQEAEEAAGGAVLESTRPDRLVVQVRAAVAIGDDDGVAAGVDALRDLAARRDAGASLRAAGAWAEAVRLAGARRPASAARRYGEAARLWSAGRRRVLAAEAWASAAHEWHVANESATADRALAQAESEAAALRLGPLSVRVRELRGRLDTAAAHPDLARLTARELDVLRLVAEGRTNREIAATLYLATGTVRNYVSSAFTKLGVTRRSQAAVLFATAT